MKRGFLLLFASLCVLQLASQNSQLEWFVQYGPDSAIAFPTDLLTDKEGNVITLGHYTETFDADPSLESYFVNGIYGNDNYIQKLDCEGNFLWLIRFSEISDFTFSKMTVDEAGDIILIGRIQERVDFYFGSEVVSIESSPTIDEKEYFLIKISKDGALLWLQKIIGIDAVDSVNMVVDASSNIYITGAFSDELSIEDSPLSLYFYNPPFLGSFILKLDPTGTALFFEDFKTDNGGITVKGLTIDADGGLYLSGAFNNTVDVDPGDGAYYITSMHNPGKYLMKLDGLSMNMEWVKSKKGKSTNYALDMEYGEDDGIYMSFILEESEDLDFEDDLALVEPKHLYDQVLVKYDGLGNFEWAKQFEKSFPNTGGISIAQDGGVYMMDNFEESISLAIEQESIEMISSGAMDFYLLHISEDGDISWSKQMGGLAEDKASCILSDIDGNLLVSGSFQDSFDLGLDYSGQLVSEQSGTCYIMKIDVIEDLATANQTNEFELGLGLFPNPSQGLISLSFDKEIEYASIKLYDSRGVELESIDFDKNRETHFRIDGPAGLYYLILESKYGLVQRQIIKF